MQLWKWDLSLSAEVVAVLADDKSVTRVTFANREQWWDILFNIDLIVCLLSIFFTIPHPWNILYHVFSEGFFAVWFVRMWMIRKRYFLMTVQTDP